MVCVSELRPPFEPSGFSTPMPPPGSIPKLRMSRMCLCMNTSFGRPICSQTITCSFSKSFVAPSRGNCGGHFFEADLSGCAAMPATPTTLARAQMPSTTPRRLRCFTLHLQTLSNLIVGAGTSCHLVVGLSKTYVQIRFEPAAGGELEHSTFVRRVAEQVTTQDRAFDPDRSFCETEELLH